MEYRRAIRSFVSTLGYRELKEEQEEIILRFIFGNNVFGVLVTVFGKSFCYTCFFWDL